MCLILLNTLQCFVMSTLNRGDLICHLSDFFVNLGINDCFDDWSMEGLFLGDNLVSIIA